MLLPFLSRLSLSFFTLLLTINYRLTKYLENINFVPKIAEKVSGKPVRTRLSDKDRKALKVYMILVFIVESMVIVWMQDHVIPFNFIYSTEIFNFVRACRNSNSQKSDILPARHIFDKVLQRNKTAHIHKRL